MGEDNLERRIQVLSSEEEKGLAALMKLQKLCQSHLEGQKGQELTFLEVLCTLRTPSLSQPLVMMRRGAHTGRNPLSYGPPWAHCLAGYQDQILGGPFGLFGLCHTAPDDVRCKDYGGEVLG
jgi:hypothetical protein